MVINKLGLATISSNIEKTEKLHKKDEKLEKVAHDFESVFLKKLFDEMDKTIDRKNSLFYGGEGEEIFRSMLNEERAKNMAKSGGIGLAEIIYKQLSQKSKEGKDK